MEAQEPKLTCWGWEKATEGSSLRSDVLVSVFDTS